MNGMRPFPLFLSIHSLSYFYPLYVITFSMTFPLITISKYSSALVTRPEFASRKSALTILPKYGLFCPSFSVVTMWEVRVFREGSRVAVADTSIS